MNINQYAVYQLKESAELAAYRSRSYQYLTEHHFQVIVQNYQQAYFTKLFTSETVGRASTEEFPWPSIWCR